MQSLMNFSYTCYIREFGNKRLRFDSTTKHPTQQAHQPQLQRWHRACRRHALRRSRCVGMLRAGGLYVWGRSSSSDELLAVTPGSQSANTACSAASCHTHRGVWQRNNRAQFAEPLTTTGGEAGM